MSIHNGHPPDNDAPKQPSQQEEQARQTRQAPTTPATDPQADPECFSAEHMLSRESADFLTSIGATFDTGALFRLIFPTDAPPRFSFLTSGFETLFGVPVATAMQDAQCLYSLFVPEDREAHRQRVRRSMKHQTPLASEVRMRSQVSGVRWIQFRAQPGYDTRGTPCLDGLLIDITVQKQIEDQLREMATTDSLTALANRRHFMQCAEAEVRRALRYGRSLSMLMVDADHFKNVNDTYGHTVGDVVLSELACMLRDNARQQDTAARLGGEEFALLLPETDMEHALEAAERLRTQVADTAIEAEGNTVRITVSVGVSELALQGDTLSRLLKRADDALYDAKQNGRNHVRHIPPPSQQK